MLLLLNTYPLRVSQDLVFRSKATTLQSSVSVMVYSLSGLDRLTEENVAAGHGGGGGDGPQPHPGDGQCGQGPLRHPGDRRRPGGVQSSTQRSSRPCWGTTRSPAATEDGAFRSRAASPVLYQNQIIGAVYAYEYDTEQAALLEGLQGNLLRLSAGIAVVVLVSQRPAVPGADPEDRPAAAPPSGRCGRALTATGRRCRGRDEIAQLAQEFNSLTDRLQTTENARRRFVSDASHELKTPLAAIRLLTDSILQTENIDRETAREFVTDIGQEAERLSRITEDLLPPDPAGQRRAGAAGGGGRAAGAGAGDADDEPGGPGEGNGT